MTNPLFAIPARMAATRFPDKPLVDIGGEPMVFRIWRLVHEAGIGPVVVAAGDQEIVDAVESRGGRAVLTDPNLPCGTDRVQAAAATLDPDKKHDVILNVQGDLPSIAPDTMTRLIKALEDNPEFDITTPIVPITDPKTYDDPNSVKAAISLREGAKGGRALYFGRANIPYGEGPRFHHLGVYCYRREAIDRYSQLPQGVLEKREKLEQLRALENGMSMMGVLVEQMPLEVNTPEDLERVRAALAKS